MADETSTTEVQEYYKLINAGGNHYDIGRKMTDAFTPALHKRLSLPPDPALLENALRAADGVFDLHPVLKDELQGIAEGISIEFEAMLVETSDFRAGPTHSMTVLAREGNSFIVGRSFSGPPSTYVRNLLRLDPNDSYASLGRMSGYFGGTWESIGVYGQFVCADILSANSGPRQGPAAYMVPRMITESSKSIETAVEKMKTVVPMHDSTYIITGSDRAYMYVAQGGRASMEEITAFPFVAVNGRRLGAPGDVSGKDGVRAVLSSHDMGGCLHGAETETLYSLIVDMGSEEIEYSNGAPCTAGFNKVDWPGGYG